MAVSGIHCAWGRADGCWCVFDTMLSLAYHLHPQPKRNRGESNLANRSPKASYQAQGPRGPTVPRALMQVLLWKPYDIHPWLFSHQSTGGHNPGTRRGRPDSQERAAALNSNWPCRYFRPYTRHFDVNDATG